MVNGQQQGQRWAGFAPGTSAAADVAGTFRGMIDPDSIRVVEGKFGKQFEVSVRVDLPDREQRVTVWCPYNTTPRSKFISLLKALNGIAGDLPPSYDLSRLATDGDLLVAVETNDKGYVEIKGWFPMVRDARGVPIIPGRGVMHTPTDVEPPF